MKIQRQFGNRQSNHILSIRLDYWLQFPGRRGIPPFSWKPGPLSLAKQLLGRVHERWRVHERSTDINLLDGGHIENLAIYELPRRRRKFIVVIDGECDQMRLMGFLRLDEV